MELALLAERDLSYARRFRRRRPFSPASTPPQSEVRPSDRAEALSWLLDVFQEQSWPLNAFCLAVQIADRFLEACCHVRRSQLQLLAVVCACVAGKATRSPGHSTWEHNLRVYTDNSVTAKEVRVRESSLLLLHPLCPADGSERLGASAISFFAVTDGTCCSF